MSAEKQRVKIKVTYTHDDEDNLLYKASIRSKPRYHANGRSRAEAVGNLILFNQYMLGFDVDIPTEDTSGQSRST